MLLLFLGSVAAQWILGQQRRGLASLAAALVMFLLAVAQFIVDRKHADESEGKDPYSPPTSITR